MTELKRTRQSIAPILQQLKATPQTRNVAEVCFDCGYTDGAIAAVEYLIEAKVIPSDQLPVVQDLFKQLVSGPSGLLELVKKLQS